MITGVSSKYNFGWDHEVVRFANAESAEYWLNKEQYDFRDRQLFDSPKEAYQFIRRTVPKKKAIRMVLESNLATLNSEGYLDIEFSPHYIRRMFY